MRDFKTMFFKIFESVKKEYTNLALSKIIFGSSHLEDFFENNLS